MQVSSERPLPVPSVREGPGSSIRCWSTFALSLAGLLALLLARPAEAVPASDPGPPGWTSAAPMVGDPRPSLQSEPALALAGDQALIGWADSRNAGLDVYTVFWHGDAPAGELQATNLAPHGELHTAVGPTLALEASGRAFAVYSNGEHVYLVRYDPTSHRWSAPTQVTSGLEEWHQVARDPQVATDGSGDLVVVWEDDRNANPENDWADSRSSDIYAAVCNGDAMTCADNLLVNDDGSPGDQRRPRLSRRGEQVAAIWEDDRDLGGEAPQIYAALSNDGGRTWGANTRVSRPDAAGRRDSAVRPAIAYTADGGLAAAWEHHAGAATAPADIVVAVWNGSSWDAPVRVDRAPARVRSLAPVLAAGDAGLFLAWQDHRRGSSNPDIYAARQEGGGWSEMVVTSAAGAQTQPALAAAGDSVRIVWQGAQEGSPDIYTARWQGGGWSDAVRVHDDAERTPRQMAPTLASYGGVTYAVFFDNRAGYDNLWLSTLPSGDDRWSTPTSLPTSARSGSYLATEGA